MDGGESTSLVWEEHPVLSCGASSVALVIHVAWVWPVPSPGSMGAGREWCYPGLSKRSGHSGWFRDGHLVSVSWPEVCSPPFFFWVGRTLGKRG